MNIIMWPAVIVCFIAMVTWLLVRVAPSLGFFRAGPVDSTNLENGFVLVHFEGGKAVDALSLNMVATGWLAVWQVLPLIIIGIMVGYLLGDYFRFGFTVKKPLQENLQNATDALTKELKADKMLKEARSIQNEVPKLRQELSEARRKLKVMAFNEEDMLKNFADLRRRKESVDKELYKARAKIIRLSDKNKNSIEKTIESNQL